MEKIDDADKELEPKKKKIRICINCDTPTQVKGRNGLFFGFCPNEKCDRYGLHTLVWKEPEAVK